MDWKNFFDRLGMNGTRWQWRIMRWERNWKALVSGRFAEVGFSLSHLLVGVNVVLFIAMVVQGLFTGSGLGAVLTPRSDLLYFCGGYSWYGVLTSGEWWRCLTYAYTHGGLIHLGFNMMVLYQVGPMLERAIGPARFFVLYTLTALTAAGLGYYWNPPMVVVIGASGSLFGLIGFSITFFHRMGPMGRTLRDFMLKWALFAFVFGLIMGADNAGHLGGALGGAAIGAVLPLRVRDGSAATPLFNLLAVVCLVATLYSFGALFLSWFRLWVG